MNDVSVRSTLTEINQRNVIMKKYLFLFLGLSLAFSCSRNSNQETIKAYIAAHNEHNVEQAISFYNPNIIFELKNTWTKKGIQEIRSLEVWDSTINSNLELQSLYTVGDSVFCKIIETNDWFSSIGIAQLINNPTIFVVKDNKITNILATPSQETGRQIDQAIGSIMEWSINNQDSTIYSLIPNGQFVYSSEAAQKWMALFKIWHSSQN